MQAESSSATPASRAARSASGEWRLLRSVGLAVLAVGVVAVSRILLDYYLNERAPLILFTLAVMVAARHGGLWAGLLATALSMLVGNYLLIYPRFSMAIDDVGDVLQLGLLALAGIGISILSDDLLRSRAAADRSEARYRALVHLSPQAVWMALPDGRLEFANQYFLDFTGLTLDEAKGDGWVRALHPEHRDRVLSEWRRALATGSALQLELPLRHGAGGEYRWHQTLAQPLRGDRGQIARWIGIGLDIHDRRTAEEALRESQARLAAILEQLPLGVGLLDSRGCWVARNPMLGDLLGDTIPSQGPSQTDRWIARTADGRKRDAVEFPVTRALRGESGPAVDYLHVTGDTESWMRIGAAPFRGAGGEIQGAICVVQDIDDQKRAEDAVRESEERFRNLADNAPVMVWVTEPDGTCSFLSRSWYEFTGQTPETGLGIGWLDAVHPGDRREAERIFQKANAEHGSFRMEYRLRRHDGEWRWSIDAAAPRFSPDGAFRGFVGSVIDITDRKRDEEVLRTSEARLQLAQSAGRVGVWDWVAASDESYWSEAMWSLYGREPLVGGSIQEFWRMSLEPEDRERVMGHIAEFFAGSGTHFRDEFRIRRPDGTTRWLECVARLDRDSEGRPVRMFGVNVDLTARRHAERALRESEARFRGLAEAVPEILFTTTADGGCDFASPTLLNYTGLTAGQLLGFGWMSALHPDDAESTASLWGHSVNTGERFEMEYRLRRRDGAYHWFIARATPLRDEAGRIVKWFGAATDIEEQKRTEQDLRVANDDLRQFAWAASHDLKEPLRMVVTFTELLEQRYAGKLDGEGLRAIRYAVEGANRMSALLSGLSEYWRAKEHTSAPGASTGLEDALGAALGNLHAAIAESGAVITHDPLPQVRAGESPMVQVFQNLVSNAIKYRDPERTPRVHIAAVRERGFCRVSVEDNGIGIAPEHQGRIFAIFKRLHSRDRYPGAGIGLALCQTIIEREGGRIWVESSPGKGARFHFTLPDAATPSEPGPRDAQPATRNA
ncbi:MAG: PAS domain S-box protein [Bryobacteraceae bacterium]|nr:PAS domain S-box protein [Bryobacteraceae bacterium]